MENTEAMTASSDLPHTPAADLPQPAWRLGPEGRSLELLIGQDVAAAIRVISRGWGEAGTLRGACTTAAADAGVTIEPPSTLIAIALGIADGNPPPANLAGPFLLDPA